MSTGAWHESPASKTAGDSQLNSHLRSSKMDIDVRPASSADLQQVQAIYEHYVLNTVNSFTVRRPPADWASKKFEVIQKRHLPFLVADDRTGRQILGYCYATGFRTSLGYGPSVELSLFCRPDYTSKGVGSGLMRQLLNELSHARHTTWEDGHEDNLTEYQVKKAIVVMAVDPEASHNGLGLRDWYIDRFGFEQVGWMKGVGDKKGRV